MQMTNTQRVSLGQIASRGLRMRCPNCGAKTLFQGWFKLNEHCKECSLNLVRASGFTLGAMVINYGIIVFGMLPLILVAYWLKWISTNAALIAAGVLAVGIPAALYPLSWSLWLMVYYLALPHELPNNRTDAIPVSDHE
ncbi:MAG TPA: DUF983 domain-containing protein [Opitutae bacterium]|nr:DUF983 domain-containing protein [Opitutae bacterium]|tara:strand:- start:196 stop:612 length:417 start_codon:yes stop_codon:yes gene_type:complete